MKSLSLIRVPSHRRAMVLVLLSKRPLAYSLATQRLMLDITRPEMFLVASLVNPTRRVNKRTLRKM